VEGLLGRLEEGLLRSDEPPLPDGEIELVRRRLSLLRAFLAAQQALARSDEGELARLVAETAGAAAGEEARWAMIALGLRFWLEFSLRLEGPRLVPDVQVLKARALAAGEYQVALTASVWLAAIYEAAGQRRLAEQECVAGLALADKRGIRTPSAGYLHLILADSYAIMDRPEEAEAALGAAIVIARTWQQLDQLLSALWQRAHLALRRAEPAVADGALREAEAIIQREQMALQASFIAAARVRYWLATGDLESAARWAARVVLDPQRVAAHELHSVLALVRVALARRRNTEALAILDRFAAHLDRSSEMSTMIGYLALRIAALHGAGEAAQARAVAARLLALTAPEGWLRPYLDAGAPMAAALAALLDAPDDVTDDPPLPRAYVSHLLAAFDDERRAGRALGPAATPRSGPAALAEPLTRREREVLRLLADGASNQEIAAALSLSVNTIKRHVGGLLGKLGATGRTGAVARARATGLL